MKTFTYIATALLLCCTTQLSAYEIDKWENHPIQIHGSFGQGWITSDETDWLTFNTERGEGDFSFNDFVINGSIVLNDSLTFGAQVISRDFGDVGNNEIDLDWGYFDYNINEQLGFRLGRVKQPNGLYGDTWDLDVARTTVFLPPAYPTPFRDLFVSADGATVYGTLDMGKFGSLSYTGLFGRKELRDDSSLEQVYEALVGGVTAEESVRTDYIWGGRVIWDTPVDGLRTSFSMIQLDDVDTRASLFGTPSSIILTNLTQWFFSAEYTRGDWVIAAEFRRLDFRFATDLTGRGGIDSWGDYYIQVDNQLTDKWAMALGFGQSTINYSKKFHAGNDTVRSNAYLSARYDVNDNFLVKGDIHYINGTTELYFQTDPEPNHWLFAMKAVYYF
jgi:hypothetical protein